MADAATFGFDSKEENEDEDEDEDDLDSLGREPANKARLQRNFRFEPFPNPRKKGGHVVILWGLNSKWWGEPRAHLTDSYHRSCAAGPIPGWSREGSLRAAWSLLAAVESRLPQTTPERTGVGFSKQGPHQPVVSGGSNYEPQHSKG